VEYNRLIGNSFNGSGGYTCAIDIYASDAQQAPPTNGIIGWNAFSYCDYYAVGDSNRSLFFNGSEH